MKVKKLEELIQRKQEENRKNALNDKKILSTAYRPTNLQMPKPRILPGIHQDTHSQDMNQQEDNYNKKDSYYNRDKKDQEDFDNEYLDKNYENQENKSMLGSEKSEQSGININQHSQKSGEDIGMNDNGNLEDDISETTNEDKLFYEDVPDNNQSQSANHAKCIFDLSFTKFEWDLNEDYTRCHRPDIHSLFQIERENIFINENINNQSNPLSNSNTQISIGLYGDVKIINQQNQKSQIQTSQLTQKFVELPLNIVDRETIKSKNKKRGIINADEYFKDRVKLSLKDGQFCIFEHIDQHPIYVNNFGMVSELQRHIYSEKFINRQEFLPSSTNLKVKHMGPYGKQILKGANSKLPLLGNIDKSKFQGVSILTNKLYRAPVFFHKTQQTDFFCSFHEDRKGQKKIVLREIQSLYTVGQIEPIKSIYDPQSRSYQNYIKQRCQAYILRFLQENKNWIDFQNIQNMFPYLTDQKLKKFIKEISVEVNRDQICSSQKQINDETIKNLITPEMICQYESARYGEAMLSKRGILCITKAGKISYASNRYCQDQKNVYKQKISKFIENEVLCTPWNLSQNFCTIHSSHNGQAHSGMLMIKGVGDPSNGNGGYSFLKMPLKISNDSLLECMRIRVDLNPAIQNPKSVTGTDADLRKLKKEVIQNKLVEMGYDFREIQSMTRWNMVGLLREQSSSLQRSSQLDEKNKRYARGIRYTSKTQREVYHKRVDEVFKAQMFYLSGQKDLDDFSDDQNYNQKDEQNDSICNPQDQKQLFGASLSQDDDKDSDGDNLGFNQLESIKKFTVEINDKNQIQAFIQEKSRYENGLEINSMKFISSIQKIFDIPNFKKLLLAKIDSQNLNSQQGQQVGLLRSGTNQINQIEGNVQQKSAEQQLEEGLNNQTLDLNIEILKKVIRKEDQLQEIERIEFISADKVINRFKKILKKIKSPRLNRRITNLKPSQSLEKQINIEPEQQRIQSVSSNSNLIKLEGNSTNGNQITQQIKLSSNLQIELKGNNQFKKQTGNDDGLTIPLNSQQNKVGFNDRQKQFQKPTKVIGLGQIAKGENIEQVLQNQAMLKSQQQNRLQNYNNQKTKINDDGEFKMPKQLNQFKDGSQTNSRYKSQKSISSSSAAVQNKDSTQIKIQNIDNTGGIIQNDQINFNLLDINQLAQNPLFQNLLNLNAQGLIVDQQNNISNIDSHIQINKDYQINQDNINLSTEIEINLNSLKENTKNKKQKNEKIYDQYDDELGQEQKEQKGKKSKSQKKQWNDQMDDIKQNKQANENRKSQKKQLLNDKNDQLIASLQKEQENLNRANKKLQTSRRAKQSGESILNGIIEQIVEDCIKQDKKNIFRYKVEKSVAPNYYNVIKNPICLEVIKQKARRQEYKNINSFKDDMTLMRTNCETFNGLNNEYSQTAAYLEQYAQELIDSKEYNESIQTASIKIDYQE